MNPVITSKSSGAILDYQPFRPWRYDSAKVDISNVIAPPYDVISQEKQKKLYQKSPYNCVRLILNLKEAADNEQKNTYTRAKGFFNEWRQKGILVQDDEPSFYVYSQTFKDPISGKNKTRYALLGRVRLEPFEKGIIIPHEKTLSAPKQDRLKLITAVQANLSPVFGLYKDDKKEISKVLQDPGNSKELFEAEDDDRITHTLSRIDDPKHIAKIHQAMKTKKVYIADGHHRYETALEYSRLRREEIQASEKDVFPFDYVYMALVSFDDPGFIVLPTHRIVSDLGMSGKEALKKLETCFKIEKSSIKKLEQIAISEKDDPISFGLLLKDEGAFLLTLKDRETAKTKMVQGKPEIWYDLNVNLFGHLILAGLLGIPESQWESLLKFDHTVEGAVAITKKEKAQAAFFLKAPKVEMLEKMGAVGERMPQKSTFFYPKLATGLVFYSHQG